MCSKKFPDLSDTQLKTDIFDGPRIRTMFSDENFITITDDEKGWHG